MLRITWNDCLRNGACAEALPAFRKVSGEQGHADELSLVFPDGWTEADVATCLSQSGGARALHFLERTGLVPIVEVDKTKLQPKLRERFERSEILWDREKAKEVALAKRK